MKKNNSFEKLVKMTQPELKTFLTLQLKSKYDDVESKDGYVFAKGTYPVLLVAHMDTVHLETPKQFKYKKNGDVISSPQGLGGDDRCGVYMILKIIKEIKCSVLFVEDEEVGSVGAKKFVKSFKGKNELKLNYIIEFDRRNANDAVYYDLDNKEFEDFVTESSGGHFETAFGSFSDICVLAPFFRVAAVNLSCGYYKEHTLETYTVYSEMEKNIAKAKEIIKTKVDEPFEWKEVQRTDLYGLSNLKGFYEDDYYYDVDEYVVRFIDKDGADALNIVNAVSPHEAIGYTVESLPYIKGEDIVSAFTSDEEKEWADRWYIDGKEKNDFWEA